MPVPKSIRWRDGRLWLLDQRLLPGTTAEVELHDAGQVAVAIRDLVVRGAPAIGIAAAYGMALAWRGGEPLDAAAKTLVAARPTAVNLAWAVRRMLEVAAKGGDLVEEARTIHAEDAAMCRAIGRHGGHLIAPGANLLTHCNAGALAVSELGTATAPMYRAHERGVPFHVFVDETRPVLQGARLTAWELGAAGIDCTLICDGAAAHLMGLGQVDLVIVGTDRVTANGDVVNKIGTRALAIAAHWHDVPFYVACPASTFDPSTPTGQDVAIEERNAEEVTASIPTPAEVRAHNPAFDVTPSRFVTAIITEHGVAVPPYDEALRALVVGGGAGSDET